MKIYAIYYTDSGRFAGVSLSDTVGAGHIAKLVDVDIPEILPPPIEAASVVVDEEVVDPTDLM